MITCKKIKEKDIETPLYNIPYLFLPFTRISNLIVQFTHNEPKMALDNQM